MLSSISAGNYETAKLSYQAIKGSPYLNEEAIEGQLVLNDGSIMKNVPLRIDMYSGEVIATNPKGEEIALDGRYYKEVQIPFEGQDLVFKKVNESNPDQFYQVLYEDGDMAFFKLRKVSLREGKDSGIAKTDSRFTERTKYYIKHGDNLIAKVRLKKKDIFPLIPESELYAMEDFARRKGIKLKDERDFIAFFEGNDEE